ncbi:hypothetical protein AMTR_s00067p00041050 [Amborella trichopoda]|uniref:PGG domain-containing protein n=1 Tax=Amborella trichopoda TaxID=13333 RepID=U5DBE8_AMBTC|nr:hypothetical protein AMTR_s00067p00041050 [Amborella trichopoda]
MNPWFFMVLTFTGATAFSNKQPLTSRPHLLAPFQFCLLIAFYLSAFLTLKTDLGIVQKAACFSSALAFSALMAASMPLSTYWAPWFALSLLTLSYLLRCCVFSRTHQVHVSGPPDDAGECFIFTSFLKSTMVA